MSVRSYLPLTRAASAVLAITLSGGIAAQDFGGNRDAAAFERPSFSPYAGRNFPDEVDRGDADRRQPGADRKLPPVGNTVDIANATWTNTIGDPELIAVWTDPDFNPAQPAFYYARVIEIPTPRWTAYEAKFFGVEAPAEAPMITQERAYTSPIWYTP
jgi:hypothetical protein